MSHYEFCHGSNNLSLKYQKSTLSFVLNSYSEIVNTVFIKPLKVLAQ